MAKPISVQLYSVREEAAKDFPGTLKKIAQMGYKGVEFAGLHNHSAKEIAQLIRSLGMAASSAHVGLPTKENIHQIADEANELGYKYLISGFGPDDMKTLEQVKACAEKLAKACELAKSVGLQFAIHNHWWEFDRKFEGKTPYEIFMNTVPDLCSELDIYWSTKGGADTVELVKKWGNRIPLLHVKDGDLGERIVHKAAGDGKIPIASIVNAADPKALKWLVVELDDCDTDMMEAVAKSHAWLKAQKLGE